MWQKTCQRFVPAVQKHYSTKNASQQELSSIEDIGEITASDITEYFSKHSQLIDEFIRLGINPIYLDNKGGIFSGKKIVLTGTLSNFSRSKAAQEIEKRGGEIQSSVTKSTDIVIFGENAGSKLTKAKELGIKLMDENQFLRALNT